jgi:hypothetical protein
MAIDARFAAALSLQLVAMLPRHNEVSGCTAIGTNVERGSSAFNMSRGTDDRACLQAGTAQTRLAIYRHRCDHIPPPSSERCHQRHNFGEGGFLCTDGFCAASS